MAQTRSRKQLSARRALRRETPSTVAVLAEESDFAAMRRYKSFIFDDHQSYLRQLEGLLRALAAQGVHTRIALFDPADYEEFCTVEQLDPDTPASRSRYTAEVAAAGATVAYQGQPIDRLMPRLLHTAERERTWERATQLLAGLGPCGCCGQDIGHASSERAARAVAGLIESVGPGRHHLVCSVTAADGPVDLPFAAMLHVEADDEGELQLSEEEALVLTTVLAAGIATDGPGGIVLRTSRDGREVVRGWQLNDGWLWPLTEAEVFTAYCTDATTGEPVPPEPGVDYRPGIPVPRPEDADH
ncbi:hypothetical protein [Streptomyces gobiensis]|uniref:hypothetical protein n=1 Tax=Streptomyces gobiensis TaxID=2875706 RepID=UPI001E3136E2|nr:hypothetical protein [Streptomyces gobiensis]UGY94795.1 hypothetical protein test1122_25700 [Streptomyces gobiensis]